MAWVATGQGFAKEFDPDASLAAHGVLGFSGVGNLEENDNG